MEDGVGEELDKRAIPSEVFQRVRPVHYDKGVVSWLGHDLLPPRCCGQPKFYGAPSCMAEGRAVGSAGNAGTVQAAKGQSPWTHTCVGSERSYLVHAALIFSTAS